MRRIMIDNLTLLVGGTRLEREQQMDKFQNASDFMTAIIQNIREDDNGGFLTRLRTVPCCRKFRASAENRQRNSGCPTC